MYSYRFSEDHEFVKPNDVRALRLMDDAASSVMETFTDITLAFGQSDEFRLISPFEKRGHSSLKDVLDDQLLVQKISQRLQQATRQNIDDRRIPVYVLLCVQLDETSPRGDFEVPPVV